MYYYLFITSLIFIALLLFWVRHLAHLAYKDPLTKAWNNQAYERKRRHLGKSEKLMSFVPHIKSWMRAKKSYVFMIDLDYFKNINDTYGHDAGDKALKSFAQLIADTVRTYDTFFVRKGGDEFVLITHTEKGAWEVIAKRIMEQIASYNLVINSDHSLKMSASIGISEIFVDEKDPLNTALTRADLALYEVKKNGRGHYHFHL